jgi:hypothetical protein
MNGWFTTLLLANPTPDWERAAPSRNPLDRDNRDGLGPEHHVHKIIAERLVRRRRPQLPRSFGERKWADDGDHRIYCMGTLARRTPAST